MARSTALRLLLSIIGLCLLAAPSLAQTTAGSTIDPTGGNGPFGTIPSQNDFTALFNTNGAATIVVAILSIIVGVIFTFLGYRLFRFVLFLSGAYFFALLAYIILANVEPSGGYNYSISREAFYLIIMACSAVIGGFLSVCLWRLGLAMLGALAGAAVALFIQGLRPGGLIQVQWGFAILFVGLVIVGVILSIFLERHLVVWATAILGAYTTFVGIDFFAKQGFYTLTQIFLTSGTRNVNYTIPGGLIGMFVGCAAQAIIGILVQYKMWNRDMYGPSEYRKNGYAQRPFYYRRKQPYAEMAPAQTVRV